MTASVVAHEVLCIALFYTVFCRSVSTDDRAKADVRFAFFILGAVACMGMVAPIAWGFEPHPFALALLAAVVLVQIITAHNWAHGVPEQFVKTEFRTTRRRRAYDYMDNTHA